MKIIKKPRIVVYDIDDTIVTYEGEDRQDSIPIECFGETIAVYPHYTHIRYLKNNKKRGFFVILWSQQGHEWGAAVARALGLEEYIDLVMDKPSTYFDDLDANMWMKRVWVEDKEPKPKKRKSKNAKIAGGA